MLSALDKNRSCFPSVTLSHAGSTHPRSLWTRSANLDLTEQRMKAGKEVLGAAVSVTQLQPGSKQLCMQSTDTLNSADAVRMKFN